MKEVSFKRIVSENYSDLAPDIKIGEAIVIIQNFGEISIGLYCSENIVYPEFIHPSNESFLINELRSFLEKNCFDYTSFENVKFFYLPESLIPLIGNVC